MFNYIKNKLFNYLTGGVNMEMTIELKDALLAEGARLIDLGNLIYSKAFQDGVASVPTGGGGLSQADLDAAVLAAVEAEKVNSKAAVDAKVEQFKVWYANYDSAQDAAFDAIVNPPVVEG